MGRVRRLEIEFKRRSYVHTRTRTDLKSIGTDHAVDRLTNRRVLMLNRMKDWLRRLRMTCHCFVRSHTPNVNLLPTTLTEVIETSKITAEEIAGGRFAQ